MAKNVNRNYGYQYESVARSYSTQPIGNPSPERKPSKKHNKLAGIKLDRKFCLQLSLCGITIFISAVLYINSYAMLRGQQTELISIKNDLIEVKSNINDVKSQIASKLNLKSIADVAKSELGMQEPLPHQIVYFELSDESYTSYER